ncbi:MAG: putative glycoside hydrolase, partial [Actinomycetota bacterium]|nr:putative glycoside hydrolase [Actinomycetota bacterium]
DGDVGAIRYSRLGAPQGETVAAFLRYASGRLRPLGVRVSAAVFGLSATVDVGVGQEPRLIARAVDAVSPMVYPSHYTPGSYGLSDPNGAPAETVAGALRDFRRALRGTDARLVPWLQAFSLGRPYGLAEVQAQVDAARAAGADGFLLWEHEGIYGTRVAALKAGYAGMRGR